MEKIFKFMKQLNVIDQTSIQLQWINKGSGLLLGGKIQLLLYGICKHSDNIHIYENKYI